jgi:hypothetical protein
MGLTSLWIAIAPTMPIAARPANPPTTPPAIAPAFEPEPPKIARYEVSRFALQTCVRLTVAPLVNGIIQGAIFT